jgi:hypothetical protein
VASCFLSVSVGLVPRPGHHTRSLTAALALPLGWSRNPTLGVSSCRCRWAIIRGSKKPPQAAYAADLAAVRKTWTTLSPERRELLFLLSRFSLSPDQARR